MKMIQYQRQSDCIKVVYGGVTLGKYYWAKDKTIEWCDARDGSKKTFPDSPACCEWLEAKYPKIKEGNELEFQYNDGGRSKYFKADNVGDCVTRAIAIASGRDYKEVYDYASQREKQKGRKKSARNGVASFREVASHFGGIWHPLMKIGSGCKAHLRKGEIPMQGRIVCQVSNHLTAVIDGVLNDTYDCTKGGNRCVYGYWEFK